MVKRVIELTPAQTGRMEAHAVRWIEIGLRTGAGDRPAFEAGARRCYELAGLPWHGHVVWVGSPWVLALAAPIAALHLRLRSPDAFPDDVAHGIAPDTVHVAVDEAVRGCVDLAVRNAVAVLPRNRADSGVRLAVDHQLGALRRAALEAMDRELAEALGRAQHEVTSSGPAREPADSPLRDAVRAASGEAVDGTTREVVERMADVAGRGVVGQERVRMSLSQALSRGWGGPFIGGQLCATGRYHGPALASFFREVCDLELEGDLWERAAAYEATVRSACWWYPHRDFVMVCERPAAIHRELLDPSRARGRLTQRLHRADGPALVWPDGWGVHALHGHRVPGWLVEHPEEATVEAIEAERNAEVRRLMLDAYGWRRYIADCGAEIVDEVPLDDEIAGLRGARLLRKTLPGEPEAIVYLEMINSTPEPEGTHRRYLERIDPNAYGGDAGWFSHAAMASRWWYRDEAGQMRRTFERWRDYQPTLES